MARHADYEPDWCAARRAAGLALVALTVLIPLDAAFCARLNSSGIGTVTRLEQVPVSSTR